MSRDIGGAVQTLLVGPFMALAIGLLFYIAAKFYVILRPAGTSGPFADAYHSIGRSLSVSYSLFQLASSIETWIAVAVIVISVCGFFVSLTGSRGGFSRR